MEKGIEKKHLYIGVIQREFVTDKLTDFVIGIYKIFLR